MRGRVLLLMPTSTYKSRDFLEAAERLGVEVVVGTERKQALEDLAPGHTLTLDFARAERSVGKIVEHAKRFPFDAVVGADDETTVLAALAGQALGLPHNPPGAVRVARDKYEMRRCLARAGLHGPRFRRIELDQPVVATAAEFDYPVVLKPLSLSASRGVLRADDPDQFIAAFQRIAAILRGTPARHLLVETFMGGPEVALEGLLEHGRLRVLALFDKPDPLDGPTFEETIYVTPSRLGESERSAISSEAAEGCRALGLTTGPIHAELRLTEGRPWIVEVAARSIGGLCSRALSFGTGRSLEELILLQALGKPTAERIDDRASGVMMIPIPRAGVLRDVRGLTPAREVEHIVEIEVTAHRGAELTPLPEGHRYLGFIFARGPTPDGVERALREAHVRLEFDID